MQDRLVRAPLPFVIIASPCGGTGPITRWQECVTGRQISLATRIRTLSGPKMRGWPISADRLPHAKVAALKQLFSAFCRSMMFSLNIRPILPDQPDPSSPPFFVTSILRFAFSVVRLQHIVQLLESGSVNNLRRFSRIYNFTSEVFSTELFEKLVPTRSSVPRHFVTLHCDHTASHSMSARVPALPYALFR